MAAVETNNPSIRWEVNASGGRHGQTESYEPKVGGIFVGEIHKKGRADR